MDKNTLGQLKALKIDIEDIKKDIEDLKYHEEQRFVSDSVKGSMRSHPWTERSIVITGADSSEYFREITKLREKLQRKVMEHIRLVDEIDTFIDSIDDATLRLIVRLKYVNGLTMESIGKNIGYAEVTVRKKHEQFIKSLSENIT